MRRIREKVSSLLGLAMFAAVVVASVAPAAGAHIGTAVITCTNVHFSYTSFSGTGSAIDETVTIDGKTAATARAILAGSAGSDDVAISVPSGSHVVKAHAQWTADGGGQADATQTLSGCSTTPPPPATTADVSVVKTADQTSITAGQKASFTIVVKNAGSGTAKNVTLSDSLPVGITWSEDNASCWLSKGALICNFGDMPAGASQTVHVSGSSSADCCSTLSSTAVVESDNDNNLSNNHATATITCASATPPPTPGADVSVVKTADQASITAGSKAAFTIVVKNAGPGTAKNVTLGDFLPGGITWTVDSSSCWLSKGELICNFGDMPAGSSQTIHVSGLTTTSSTTLSSTTFIEADNDTTPANNRSTAAIACVSVTPPPVPVTTADVSVVKTADQTSITAGSKAAFTIVVKNAGPGTAKNVTLGDFLPGGITWTVDSSSCWLSKGELICNFGDLPAGATQTIHVSGLSSADCCSTISSTAFVEADNDTSTANNRSTASIGCAGPAPRPVPSTPGSAADVMVLKTNDQVSVTAGQRASFTIVVSSVGQATATSVTLGDWVPAGIAWSADSSSCWFTKGELICNFGDLAPGASRVVHLGGTAPAGCSTIANTAFVEAANDANTANNRSSASIGCSTPSTTTTTPTTTTTTTTPYPGHPGHPGHTVPAHTVPVRTVPAPRKADVAIVKKADSGSIAAGTTAAFTIVVSSVGSATATAVTVGDHLPGGIAWSQDSSSCWITGGELICNFHSLEPGSVRIVRVTGASSATCSRIENTAFVQSNDDTNAANNRSTDTIACHAPFAPPKTITPKPTKPTKPTTPTAPAHADVSVDKRAEMSSTMVGRTARFDIVVTNHGPGVARAVTLGDWVPAGASWTVHDAHCGFRKIELVCSFGDLAAGATRVVRLTGTVTRACTTLSNTAFVGASNDLRPGDNRSTAAIHVGCARPPKPHGHTPPSHAGYGLG